MPLIAPASLFVGLASFMALMGMAGLVIALSGVLLGLLAVLKIARSRGQLSGRLPATLGLVLSAVFFVSGSGILYYEYVNELPEGYRRVHFPNEISANQFDVVNGRPVLHPAVKPLVGKKLFLKGYMWGTQVTHGLDRFVLLKDNGKCCFGGDPAPWDMMEVRLQGGRTVDKLEGLVAVGGILRADPAAYYERGEPAYVLEADYFSRAKTAFGAD
ncbi:MAG: hypothetical protein KY476_02980 [Planctomycetes bacterium]|nr:hypothetical protein [Planctomycetota bacterium]